MNVSISINYLELMFQSNFGGVRGKLPDEENNNADGDETMEERKKDTGAVSNQLSVY